MQSTAKTPEEYILSLPADRQASINRIREVLLRNLPEGFEEGMYYGMLGYVVPHRLYSKGYHCDPKQPLPFINLASQKNAISLYHMGLYASPTLLNWFQESYSKVYKSKLDMGKSCIRFKKPDDIPYDLIAELARRITPEVWIEKYEEEFVKQK